MMLLKTEIMKSVVVTLDYYGANEFNHFGFNKEKLTRAECEPVTSGLTSRRSKPTELLALFRRFSYFANIFVQVRFRSLQ